MRSGTTIQSFPVDVIWALLESDVLEHRDLFALCLVRAFHNVALRLLYRSFPRHGDIYLFLTKILRDPQLAAQVRFADVSWCTHGCSSEDMALYCDSVLSLDCPRHIQVPWTESLRAGEYGAFVFLLLVHLPGLRRLNIESPSQAFLPVVGMPRYLVNRTPFVWLIDPSVGYPGWFLDSLKDCIAFPSLQEISLQGIPYRINSVAAVFGIRSIRKVRLSGMVDDDAHELELTPKSSNVEELTFENVGVSFHCLARIVMACKKLKRFSYHTPVDARVSRELPALVQILETFGDSLEEIQIRHLSGQSVTDYPLSFSRFPALRRLVCDASALTTPLRHSALSLLLPASIQHVHIHGIHADFTCQFGELNSIREDLMQRESDGALFFLRLREVRLVKEAVASRQDGLGLETCTVEGVKFSVEHFGILRV